MKTAFLALTLALSPLTARAEFDMSNTMIVFGTIQWGVVHCDFEQMSAHLDDLLALTPVFPQVAQEEAYRQVDAALGRSHGDDTATACAKIRYLLNSDDPA